MFERFFEELADIAQGLTKSTVSIIIGVLIALTFYFFALHKVLPIYCIEIFLFCQLFTH